MKKYILFIILTMCCFVLKAETKNESNDEKFKLLKQLSLLEQSDTARLGVYFELTRASNNPQVELYYINKLLKEADKFDNNYYRCKAYLRYMIYAYNQYDVEQVNKWMKVLEPIATKEKYYDLLFLGRRCVIDMLMINGEYEREEKEAKKMLKDAEELNNNIGILSAYQCLSNVYRMINRLEEALQIMQKGYKLACQVDQSSAIEINNSIIAIYQSKADMNNWIKWTRTMDDFLQEQIDKDPANEIRHQGWLMMTAASYIKYYTYMDDLSSAAKYVEKIRKYNMEGHSTFSFHYHNALYTYYVSSLEYEKALVETEKLAEIYKELSPLNYSIMTYKKADILQQQEKFDEAIAAYKRALEISDSISIVFMNKQIEQLKKDYDTEQFLLEKEQINQKIQVSYLCLIGLVIIIVVAFAIQTRRTQKGLKHSEEEMRKLAEEMEQADIDKATFLSTISTAISIPLNEVVKGSLQLVNDETTDEKERREISRNLNRTSAELMKLINNILNLSRLEAGMMKFKKENIEILPFVQGIVNMATSNGKKINAELPELKSSMYVFADISWLQEVFSQLLADSQDTLSVTMQVQDNPRSVVFEITNSILSEYPQQPRDIAMANEINRLAIMNFSGHYEVNVETHTITFTLPLV